jgi:uncharacterized protein YdeI (YjbR/CyaY-like superfamily)
MEIGHTLRAKARPDWRAWLERNHASATEIWLVLGRQGESLGLSYLDAVEEAICFGWIDGIAKALGGGETAQRFTPRRARSNWTELNGSAKDRLIMEGIWDQIRPGIERDGATLIELAAADAAERAAARATEADVPSSTARHLSAPLAATAGPIAYLPDDQGAG